MEPHIEASTEVSSSLTRRNLVEVGEARDVIHAIHLNKNSTCIWIKKGKKYAWAPAAADRVRCDAESVGDAAC